jgi:hypothetical protein
VRQPRGGAGKLMDGWQAMMLICIPPKCGVVIGAKPDVFQEGFMKEARAYIVAVEILSVRATQFQAWSDTY